MSAIELLLMELDQEAKTTRRVLERVGVDPSAVEFFRVPTDRGWTRDAGPTFVRRERRKPDVAVIRFGFNGWARYPDFRKDARVTGKLLPRSAWRLDDDGQLLPTFAANRVIVIATTPQETDQTEG